MNKTMLTKPASILQNKNSPKNLFKLFFENVLWLWWHQIKLSNIQFWIENINGINLVTSRDILLSMVCVLCVRHFLLFLPKWRILQSSKLQKEYDISRALVLRHSRFNISHWLRQQLRARCNRTASIFKQQEWLFH